MTSTTSDMLCWSAFAIWTLPKCSQHSDQMEMKSTCDLSSLRPLRGPPRTLKCTTFISKFQHLLNTPLSSQENSKESTTKPEITEQINLKIGEIYLDDLLFVLIPQLLYHTNSIESQNRRIILVGKGLQNHRVQPSVYATESCLSATPLTAASTQLTCLQGWGCTTALDSPFLCLITLFMKKFFLRSNLNLSWSNLTLFPHVHP